MVNRAYQQPTAKAKTPQRALDWKKLMQKAIERSDKNNDRRSVGLRKALAEGKSEQMLRRMGIISESDLLREFPEKVK